MKIAPAILIIKKSHSHQCSADCSGTLWILVRNSVLASDSVGDSLWIGCRWC